MAYARRRFRRRTPRRRRTFGRRPARRSYRRNHTRGRMTRRRVVDIASRKRQDTMPSWSDTVAGANTDIFVNDGANIVGGTTAPYTFLWSPSCRTGLDDNGSKLFPLSEGRQRTDCFLRGVSERVYIETNSGIPWRWRRIVFQAIGNPFNDSNTSTTAKYYRQNVTGYTRLVTLAPDVTDIQATVFKGEDLLDWEDAINAAVDNRRIKVLYNKVKTIQPGNIAGVAKNFKMWHPINKNMHYDDREEGIQKATSAFASERPSNCGDTYILDIFQTTAASSSTDTLDFKPQATWYWHEK